MFLFSPTAAQLPIQTCHPLNVHLGKHQLGGSRATAKPCLDGLYKHGTWEGKRDLLEENPAYTPAKIADDQGDTPESLWAQTRRKLCAILTDRVKDRTESFADNIAIQGVCCNVS